MKLSAVLLAVLLAGCAATDAGYPSLAPRAIERQGMDEPVVATPAVAAADPALDKRLATLGGKLAAVRTGHDADAARADRAARVAGARTVGSEAWLTAQTALAALDDWRAQASALATDLDTLAGDRANAGAVAYPALETLRTRATAEAERQSRAIATIGAKLPTP